MVLPLFTLSPANILSLRVGGIRLCLIALASISLLLSTNAGLAKAAARAETSPAGVVNQSNGEQWTFWVTSEGELAYWHRASATEGWVKKVLGGNVKTGSSPTALIYKSGAIFVYYVNTKGEIANWTYSGGLWQGRAFGGEVAENTSPSAATNETVQHVAYINKSGEVAQFYFNGTEWLGPTAIGGGAKAHTSPAVAVWASGETFIYYVSSTLGEIANWTFSSGKWVGRTFGGHVIENSSPSTATNGSGSVMLVSYVSSTKEIQGFLWNGTAWTGPSAVGGEGKAGTSTSTVLNKAAEVLVYYVKANDEIASWTFSGTKWTAETRGGKAGASTSPSAAIYLEKGYQYIFFANNLSEISDFAFEPAAWLGPTVL